MNHTTLRQSLGFTMDNQSHDLDMVRKYTWATKVMRMNLIRYMEQFGHKLGHNLNNTNDRLGHNQVDAIDCFKP